MHDCCNLIHPATARVHEPDAPRASVVTGLAAPLRPQPTSSRSDLLVAGALAWFVGLLLASALLIVVAVNVPLSNLMASLSGP